MEQKHPPPDWEKPAPDWEKIVQRHAERVYRIAYRILGSVHDAEDVSQNVFIEASRAHRSGPVQSWTGLLVRLATLRAIDCHRKRRSVASVADSDSVTNVGPSEEAVGRELASWLRTAILQLPDQQAAVFSLAQFEQLDRNEISAAIGISVESVSTTLYKARQALLCQLSQFQGEEK